MDALLVVGYGAGQYVLINGAGDVSTSTDGRRWSSHDVGIVAGIPSHANGLFLMAYAEKIYRSTDGTRWESAFVNQEHGVLATSYGAGTYVAVGLYGAMDLVRRGYLEANVAASYGSR